jgi:hypothetical protein
MSEQARIVYQISAASSNQPESGAFQSRLGYKPFHIGSSDNVDLRLEGADILPVHLRLLVTTTGQVMLSNLGGPDSISLDGRPVAAFTPVHWKPGAVLNLGEYRLELSVISVEGDNGQIEHVLRSVITQSSEIVAPPDDWPQDESNGGLPKSTVLFEDDPLATDDDILADDELEIPPASDDETGDFAEREEVRKPAPLAAEPPPDTEQPFEHIAGDLPDLPEADSLEDSQTGNTAVMPPSLAPSPEPPRWPGDLDHTSAVFDTLPKDWKQAGQLSIQLTVNPVTLVPGERVRVPVSIRNGHEHTLQLRVNVAGVPREWIRQPHTPLVIGPGEIGALDFIIQAPPDVNQQSADMVIRLSDYSTPDDALTLPLRLNFKSTPNLIGRLERARVTDDSRAYLYLQNHTLVTIPVFVAGHIDTEVAHVIPDQTHIELPPGQMAEIPITFDVNARPLLFGKPHEFSISVTQNKRAPLDYPGVVRIRPRVPLALILLALIMLVTAGGVIALLATRDSAPAGVITEDTPTATATSTEETAETVTATPPATEEETAPTTAAPAIIDMVTNTATSTPTTIPAPATATMTEISIIATPTRETPESEAAAEQAPLAQALDFEDPRPADCAVEVPSGWRPYTIRAGDRAFRLALDRRTTVDEIARVNCLANPRMLSVGQILLLPQS